ncbi:hypothetical protein HN358_04340 [Candidatus Uhrbacteria bacterium]|jgi:hypothetical protein|nr:hypothetical protein [Candidatus Uhrbacteria bacterium]MBT7717013.1 hypothetical protein [Candidatus Uhrbacteria bacterium]
MQFPEHLNILYITRQCCIKSQLAPKLSKDSSEVHSVTYRGAQALRWFIERQAQGQSYDAVIVEIGVHFPDLDDALIAMRILFPKVVVILNYGAYKFGEFNCDYHKEIVEAHAMIVAWNEDELIAKLLELAQCKAA